MNVKLFNDPSCRFGREHYEEAGKLSNRVNHSLINWESFKYMVFDIPVDMGDYATRYNALGNFLPPLQFVRR